MEKFCTQCGAPIPEGMTVCPCCGTPVPPAPKKKLKWWMIVIPVVLVLAIAVVLLWRPLFIRLSPELALVNAASNTLEDLTERYDGSPWEMMQEACETEGPRRVTLRLDVQGDAHAMSFDCGLSFDSQTRQAALDFLMNADGEAVDAALYLDAECAAIGSDAILAGTNYGITYETFSQDIRGNRMFSVLGEETISMLEEIVEAVQTGMQQIDNQEDRSEQYRDLVIDFVKSLDPVVGKAPLTLDGSQRSCYTITYTATGDMVADFMEQYIRLIESDDAAKALCDDAQWQESLAQMRSAAQTVREEVAESSAIFYIYKNYLVDIRSVATGVDGSGQSSTFELFLGTDASVNDLQLSFAFEAPDATESIGVTLATVKSGTGYGETLTVREAGASAISVSYDWDRVSGSLICHIDDTESAALTIHCNLIELEEGFALSFDNLFELISGIPDGIAAFLDGSRMPMTLTVKEGSAIQKPEFKNIDAWTEADFFAILKQFA